MLFKVKKNFDPLCPKVCRRNLLYYCTSSNLVNFDASTTNSLHPSKFCLSDFALQSPEASPCLVSSIVSIYLILKCILLNKLEDKFKISMYKS